MVNEAFAPLAAGSLAGASSVLVGHPFDSVKTRLQVGKTALDPSVKGWRSVVNLYRGIGPPLLTAGVVQSVNFSCFEALKRELLERRTERESEKRYLCDIFVAGAVAGSMVSLITVPVGVIKVQQQVVTTTGMLTCAKNLVREHGLRALVRGAVPGLFMEMIGRGVYITTYELVKLAQLSESDQAAVISGKLIDTDLKVKMIAAACAGTTGWLSVYAVDVTKSRMILDISRTQFPTWRQCIYDTWKEGGIRRLYRGVGFSLIRASPVAATVLPIYETSRNFFLRSFSSELPTRSTAATCSS